MVDPSESLLDDNGDVVDRNRDLPTCISTASGVRVYMLTNSHGFPVAWRIYQPLEDQVRVSQERERPRPIENTVHTKTIRILPQ